MINACLNFDLLKKDETKSIEKPGIKIEKIRFMQNITFFKTYNLLLF